MKLISRILCILLIITIFNGCKIIRASPADSSGFLANDDKLVENRKRAPFHGIYIPQMEKLERLRASYKQVVLHGIDLSPLKERLKQRKFSPSSLSDRLSDADSLKDYFENRFKLEFEKRGFEVIDAPSAQSFVWELALVDLEPTGAVVNVAATAAGIFLPGAGLAKQLAKGSIAVEGIVRDGNTGEILAEFKDREIDKGSLFTVRDFQQYSHARTTIDEWSSQFAELAATSGDVMVDDAIPITLRPF